MKCSEYLKLVWSRELEIPQWQKDLGEKLQRMFRDVASEPSPFDDRRRRRLLP